jgi:fucose 4-O-acetylase-like acetyltransferase
MRDTKHARVHPSILERVRTLAAETPPTRNRYVDLLRALSITVVVIGHWLMAAPTVVGGERFTLSDMLHVAPWSQWLTWIFQVMPLFFIVGGYANAASLRSARRSGLGYGGWVSHRLRRLVRPLTPIILLWCALAVAARWLSLSNELVESGSQVALVPTWFLAVYVMVVVVAPPMYRLWERHGLASFWALTLGAALVDWASRGLGLHAVAWVNYVFVWLAIHQIGYAWQAGRLTGPARALPLALGGFALLVVLVGLTSYPVSMVTVPGDTRANASPPTLALLALGVTHAGLVLTLEARGKILLQRAALWTATVFINGVIMTVYLWHTTVMVLMVALAEWPGGVGLTFVPNSPGWWATRLPWLAVLLAALTGFVAVFGRLESRRRPSPPVPPAWRSVSGAVAVCVGLVPLGVYGIAAGNLTGIRVWSVLVVLGGVALIEVSPLESPSGDLGAPATG